MTRSRIRSALVLVCVVVFFVTIEVIQRGYFAPEAKAAPVVPEPIAEIESNTPSAPPQSDEISTSAPVKKTNLEPEVQPLAMEFEDMGEPELSSEDQEFLRTKDWETRVGDTLGIWISVPRQRLYLLKGFYPVFEVSCATAEAGTGFIENSNQTPLGWHTVDTKLGDEATWGQVFRSRAQTSEIWQPGMVTTEDLVLTRLLWLSGLEPGRNQGRDVQGRNVDSKARFIYIHGTNQEDRIGTPSSHGCIRLTNDDVIILYDKVPTGTPVLITD